MKKIAVFFPGIGYHCDKPLLYYGRDIAAECGYEEQIKVEYSYKAGKIRGDAKKIEKAFNALYEQTCEQLEKKVFSDYDEILFVSKSIGTAVSAKYAKEHGINCKNILYTPLEQTFDFNPDKAIAFTGTADPWADTDMIKERSSSQNIPLSIYVDANHSLETKDTMNNLKIIMDVMDKTRRHIIKN